jgi:hypothetical protein
VVTVNIYLMAVLLMVLFIGDAPLNQYTLLTTLVWLYIELLRLLAKLNSRK